MHHEVPEQLNWSLPVSYTQGPGGEAVDGHILAFSNCYMLVFLRLQASLPEECLALFLEPN